MKEKRNGTSPGGDGGKAMYFGANEGEGKKKVMGEVGGAPCQSVAPEQQRREGRRKDGE